MHQVSVLWQSFLVWWQGNAIEKVDAIADRGSKHMREWFARHDGNPVFMVGKFEGSH